MKVFDCFTFFNEPDLLELRLKLLDEVMSNFSPQNNDAVSFVNALHKKR